LICAMTNLLKSFILLDEFVHNRWTEKGKIYSAEITENNCVSHDPELKCRFCENEV